MIAFIYHERYGGRGTAHHRLADSWRRYEAIRDAVIALGLPVRFYRQSVATDADLCRIHPESYVHWVRRMDAIGEGFLDDRDTPAWRGVFKRAALGVGGTLLGARLVADREATIAFNPGGGTHHAHVAATKGFCVFNDLAVAVRWLQQERGFKRPVIIDIDGHHGDGTQSIFYEEPVLTVSLHQFDGRFYPGTGGLGETGAGPGLGYSLNIPLPRRTGVAPYLRALDEVVVPVVRAYDPDIFLIQFGVDAHWQDRLVNLRLMAQDFGSIISRFVSLAGETSAGGRIVIAGGGGYTPDAVVRSWAVALATAIGAPETTRHLHGDPLTSKGVDSVREAEAHRVIDEAVWLWAPCLGSAGATMGQTRGRDERKRH